MIIVLLVARQKVANFCMRVGRRIKCKAVNKICNVICNVFCPQSFDCLTIWQWLLLVWKHLMQPNFHNCFSSRIHLGRFKKITGYSSWLLQVEAAGNLEHKAEEAFYGLAEPMTAGLLQSATCNQKQIPELVANIHIQALCQGSIRLLCIDLRSALTASGRQSSLRNSQSVSPLLIIVILVK